MCRDFKGHVSLLLNCRTLSTALHQRLQCGIGLGLKGGADQEANIVRERSGGIKHVNSTIARSIEHIVIVTEVSRWVAPCAEGVALTVEASLWAKGGVLVELLGAVTRIEQEHKVVVSDVAAGCVHGLERETGAVAQAGHDLPESCILGGRAAGRSNDLSVDGGAGVRNVAGRVAWCRGLECNLGADSESSTTGQRGGGIFGGNNVGLDRSLHGVGRIAISHGALVECALSAVGVVTADSENEGTLLFHWVVARGADTAIVSGEGARGSIGTLDGPQI